MSKKSIVPIFYCDSVAEGNSTIIPLAAGGEFVGSYMDCSTFSSIAITVVTDQYSAIDGARIEFSDDKVNIIREVKTTLAPNLSGTFFSVPCEGKYFRLRYINGATAQGVFRLQTIPKSTAIGSPTLPLVAPLLDSNSVPVTRAVFAGKNPVDGSYENAGVKDGRVQVESINVPQPLSDRFQEYAVNGSREMNVNGATTPAVFQIYANSTQDLIVDSMTFQAFASGIKIDKFLGLNTELSNGLLIEVKSDDKIFTFRAIRNTTEFNSIFSQGPGRAFDLVFASGNDSMVSTFGPSSPFVIRKQGTFATDDYIRCTVRDNISTISRLRLLASGRRGD